MCALSCRLACSEKGLEGLKVVGLLGCNGNLWETLSNISTKKIKELFIVQFFHIFFGNQKFTKYCSIPIKFLSNFCQIFDSCIKFLSIFCQIFDGFYQKFDVFHQKFDGFHQKFDIFIKNFISAIKNLTNIWQKFDGNFYVFCKFISIALCRTIAPQFFFATQWNFLR